MSVPSHGASLNGMSEYEAMYVPRGSLSALLGREESARVEILEHKRARRRLIFQLRGVILAALKAETLPILSSELGVIEDSIQNDGRMHAQPSGDNPCSSCRPESGDTACVAQSAILAQLRSVWTPEQIKISFGLEITPEENRVLQEGYGLALNEAILEEPALTNFA
jgi:hypothetical protein